MTENLTVVYIFLEVFYEGIHMARIFVLTSFFPQPQSPFYTI